MEDCYEDKYDYCYECEGYGDDYFENDNGELECYCSQCNMNPFLDDWDDWEGKAILL